MFISKDGTQVSSSSFGLKAVKEVALPDDVFSSGAELPRDLEAITISHELMDEDVRAALFEDADENGVPFEELQDDFITQAMKEPDEPDFDFRAHIARLIARSEDMIGSRPCRGWNDDEEEEICERDIEDDEDVEEVVHCSTEDKKFIEEQFEKTMMEYEDEDIGYLSNAESEEVDGLIDVQEENNLLDAALNDFIRAQEETVGVEVKKIVRGFKTMNIDEQGVESAQDNRAGVVDFHQAYLQQATIQAEAAALIALEEPPQRHLESCQEYLREVRAESEWDCETILSTYSTLENHPTLIKDSIAISSRRKNKSVKADSKQVDIIQSSPVNRTR